MKIEDNHDDLMCGMYMLEMPDKAEIVAPVLPHVVLLQGTPQKPVQNLIFQNLTFAHNRYGRYQGSVSSAKRLVLNGGIVECGQRLALEIHPSPAAE